MVRTRFAPSPTGKLHIGGLRTALYAFAMAKSQGGDFILRIEDTDKKREVAGASEEIKETLRLFGLVWDEYYIQSERLKLYQEAARQLVREKKAFFCGCRPRNPKEENYLRILRDPCRVKNLTKGAIKLLVPDGQRVSFRDFILAKGVAWDTSEVADATLLKSDGFPTYHLAAVVDDADMKITHVLRGHDWLASTPVHLLVYKYLHLPIPQIGHLTDILDPSGGKLSKRKGGFLVEDLLSEGYLREAILNFVMLLGWAPKDNREIFTLDQFVGAFDPEGLQVANPTFNRLKLDWFNGYYLRTSGNEKLADLLFEFFDGRYPKEMVLRLLPLVKERIKTLKEFEDLAGFFFEAPAVDPSLLGKNYREHLSLAAKAIETQANWDLEALNDRLMEIVRTSGFKTGDFFMDLRIAITGKKFTPPINESIIILGKDESLKRIKKLL